LERIDNWAKLDQEFIVSTLKKYLGLNRNCAQMLIDYVKDHPAEAEHNGEKIISHGVRWAWLRPNNLGHYLVIDADRGLRSEWLDGDGGDRAFDKAMRAVKDSSLINLKVFLQKVENDQIYARSESNDRRGLQLWDQKFLAKHGSLAQVS